MKTFLLILLLSFQTGEQFEITSRCNFSDSGCASLKGSITITPYHIYRRMSERNALPLDIVETRIVNERFKAILLAKDTVVNDTTYRLYRGRALVDYDTKSIVIEVIEYQNSSLILYKFK